MSINEPNKPDKYKCPDCGEKFRVKVNLIQHHKVCKTARINKMKAEIQKGDYSLKNTHGQKDQ